jgi:hypothetical protein
MMPQFYIQLPGTYAPTADELWVFAPLLAGLMSEATGKPIEPGVYNEINLGGGIIGLLEELADKEEIVYIDGLRFWVRAKVLDSPTP